ncbi:MAG: hypothetical protein KDB82_12860 [Planctomycetes bacterium]|nr:hypothetical protein [Planctomycetota bacterium]
MGNFAPQPEDSNTTGCLKVLLIVICVGLVLLVATCTAIYVASSKASDREQEIRQQASDVLKPGVTKVLLIDQKGDDPVELQGDEARLFGTIGRKELARHADTPGAFNYYFQSLRVEYTCADGSALVLKVDGREAYYLGESDEWYLGSRHHAFFIMLVFVTSNLERGIDPMPNHLGRATVQDAFNYMYIPEPTPWEGLDADEQAFVKSWINRYNKVSGEAPLDASELFPAR